MLLDNDLSSWEADNDRRESGDLSAAALRASGRDDTPEYSTLVILSI